MPFDESNISHKDLNSVGPPRNLVVNKNWRIGKEQKSFKNKSGHFVCLIIIFTFFLLLGWSSMIQPMVLNG